MEHLHQAENKRRLKVVEGLCEGCGAEQQEDGSWTSTCKTCGTRVKDGELVGLFVPHLCVPCHTEMVKRERAKGHVCRRCKQVYSCCCC